MSSNVSSFSHTNNRTPRLRSPLKQVVIPCHAPVSLRLAGSAACLPSLVCPRRAHHSSVALKPCLPSSTESCASSRPARRRLFALRPRAARARAAGATCMYGHHYVAAHPLSLASRSRCPRKSSPAVWSDQRRRSLGAYNVSVGAVVLHRRLGTRGAAAAARRRSSFNGLSVQRRRRRPAGRSLAASRARRP